jgi:hypothetical protein
MIIAKRPHDDEEDEYNSDLINDNLKSNTNIRTTNFIEENIEINQNNSKDKN